MANKLPTEQAAILEIVPPIAATAARTSAYIKPDKFGQLLVTVLTGDASATGTLTLIKAADTNGGSSQSIATAAYGGTGSVGDNKAHNINVKATDMYDADRPYFAVGLGEGVALTAAIIQGFDPVFAAPTADTDVTVAR